MLRARLAGLALLLACAAGGLGCSRDPDPMPYAIESLAVMPCELRPYDRVGAAIAGDQITAALQAGTTFRIVPVQSVARILGDPSGIQLRERFRTQALAVGMIEPALSLNVAQRVGSSGLLFTAISCGLRGQAAGDVSIVMSVFEASTGYRVWTNNRRRAFQGAPGEPAFVQVVGAMIEDIVANMPRPRGEEP